MTTPRPCEDVSGIGFVSIIDGAFPSMDDLPSEFPDEEALPSEFHLRLALLLMETFSPRTFPRDRVFHILDMYLYFPYQGHVQGLRPDWFGAVDVPSRYEGRRMRQSYVIPVEGKPPVIIVDALSEGAGDNDPGRGAWPKENAPSKWDVYETVLKIPYYVTINHETDKVQLFRHNGTMFVRETSPDGRMWMPEIGLSVGAWRGTYSGYDTVWVRFFDEKGIPIPNGDEVLDQKRAQRETAQAELRAALREVERLKEKLRAAGVDPDEYLRQCRQAKEHPDSGSEST